MAKIGKLIVMRLVCPHCGLYYVVVKGKPFNSSACPTCVSETLDLCKTPAEGEDINNGE